jgi:predicted  nucleic acid-binding Zn-ribbon protein
MPRPTISIETVQRLDDLVDEITRVRASALATEDKLRILLDEVEELQDTTDQLRRPGPY